MPISFVSASAADSSNALHKVTIPKPSGVAVGDVLVAHIYLNKADVAVVYTFGWARHLLISAGTSDKTAIFTRVVDGTEGASFTFNITSGPVKFASSILAYRGVDTTTPVNAVTPLAYSAPLTTSVDNALLLFLPAYRSSVDDLSAGVITFDPALTERTDHGTATAGSATFGAAAADEIQATAGPSTPRPFEFPSHASPARLAAIALRPAGAVEVPPEEEPPEEEPEPEIVDFVAATAADSSTALTQITLNKPTGTAAGDILIAHLVIGGPDIIVTYPDGWTQHERANTTGLTVVLATKVADGTEGASFTFDIGATARPFASSMVAYRDVDTAQPVIDTSSVGTWTTSPVTTTVANARIISLYAGRTAAGSLNGTVNAPPGTVERADHGTTTASGGFYFGSAIYGEIQAGIGPSTPRTAATLLTGITKRAFAIALRPAFSEEPEEPDEVEEEPPAPEPPPYVASTATGQELVDGFAPWKTPDLEVYLDAIGSMFGEVEDLAFDTDDDAGWSLLVNPDRARAKDLPYLGQYVGERLPLGLAEPAAREWIKDAPNQRRGTLRSLFYAAQRKLIGNRTVQIRERDPEDGADATWQDVKDNSGTWTWADVKTDDPITWRAIELDAENVDRVTVITYSQETPDEAAVLHELLTVVPADIVLNYQVEDGQSWQDVYDTDVTWTWAELKEANVTWAHVANEQPGAQVFTRPVPT